MLMTWLWIIYAQNVKIRNVHKESFRSFNFRELKLVLDVNVYHLQPR